MVEPAPNPGVPGCGRCPGQGLHRRETRHRAGRLTTSALRMAGWRVETRQDWGQPRVSPPPQNRSTGMARLPGHDLAYSSADDDHELAGDQVDPPGSAEPGVPMPASGRKVLWIFEPSRRRAERN